MSLPEIVLDDLSFEDLVREAVARIPVHSRDWTDHNIHDPGVTLIELFAWLMEIQLYRLDRVSERSLRKFLKMAGVVRTMPPKAAVVDVTFSSDLPGDPPVAVPAGTVLTAADNAGGNLLFTTDRDLTVLDASIAYIVTRCANQLAPVDNRTANGSDGLFYAPFGTDPAPGDELFLGFDKDLSGREIALTAYAAGPSAAASEGESLVSAVLAWEYLKAGGGWESLAAIDETACLTQTGRIAFAVPGPMEMGRPEGTVDSAFWVRCRLSAPLLPYDPMCSRNTTLYETPPVLDSVIINTVPATQRTGLLHFGAAATGLPGMRVRLEGPPFLDDDLKVQVGSDVWERVADFDASGPENTHYTADNESGEIVFGDGLHGEIPEEGIAITISYRSGGGAGGNIAPSSIRFRGDRAGLSAHNARWGTGGTGAETPDQAVNRVRRDLRAVSRAVTSEDFERLSLESPGGRVARAKALPGYYPGNFNSVPGIVSIIVVPRSALPRPVPSPGLLKTVYRHLDSHRLLGTEVFVVPPEYIKVGVKAEFVAKLRHDERTVVNRAIEAVDLFLDPLRGGVDGQGWPFGRPVYVSEVFEVLEGVEGIDYVASVLLKKEGSENWAGDIRIPLHALACADAHELSALKRLEGAGA